MKVTLLGFTVPDDEMDQILSTDAHMPVQTHTFAWAVVRALRSAGVELTLLSADPISSYPGNPRLICRAGSFIANGVQGRKLPFVNVVLLKHLTRFVACLRTGSQALRAWRPEVLLVHGVHSPFLFYARMCSLFLGLRAVVILTDPPGVVLPTDGAVVRTLKRLDIGLVRAALRGFDGVIALTDNLATHFAPTVPYLVVEGIVGALPPDHPRRPSSQTRILYAGGLTRAYGVDRLVEAVRALPRNDVLLRIYGRGDLVNWLSAVAEEDLRIERPQFASRDEVLREYQRSDILVQPRPVNQDLVRFSFPSKLLEYLASGTPVVSTHLPGIPSDYEAHLYWANDDSVEGLTRALELALATPWEDRQRRASEAREFIWSTRGYERQGRKMRNFLARLDRRSGQA
jgi:glycosyltransferase involved in cell wall biosynthesis